MSLRSACHSARLPPPSPPSRLLCLPPPFAPRSCPPFASPRPPPPHAHAYACCRPRSFRALNEGSEMDSWNRGDYYVVGGSGRVISDRAVSVYAGLQARAVARGLTLRPSLTDDVSAALDAQRGASVVIACGGAVGQEARDRSALRLDQHAFLERLAAEASAPLVVVGFAPGPLVVGGWSEPAAAALAVFLSGQETGHAVAALLLGEASPSGKLPVTMYASDDQVGVRVCGRSPCVFTERAHVGWRSLEGVPVAFPFGHGLSYSEFELGLAAVSTHSNGTEAAGQLPRWPRVDLQVTVRNVGVHAAREVVQLYLRTNEPLTTLRAFEKTPLLQPGQETTVSLSVPSSAFDLFDEGQQAFAPMAASAQPVLLVGTSSRDIRLQHAVAAL